MTSRRCRGIGCPKSGDLAPEVYASLASHTSWTRLLWRFLFDGELTLFPRVERHDRNHVALDDQVKPDVDALRKA